MKMGWLGFDWVHFVAFMGCVFMHFVAPYGIQFLVDAFLAFMGCVFFQMHFVVLDGMYFLLDAICGDFLRWADYHQNDQRRKVKSS